MVGREIAGRYRILAKLGEGGMGSVFRAEQISLKRTVAVKLLRPDVSENPMIVRRFNAEAEAVAKLSHPNTVNIYDFGQDVDGSLFIAMELVEGRSLRMVVAQEAPLPPMRALAIAAQVAASLADAHARSIVHRDLKPDNVMLTDRGRQRDIVRVLDFGIAKLRDESHSTQQAMTKAGDVLGTPQYMAPEQIRGEHVDGRTDVYALGCMIYEMLTARLPFEGATIMAIMSKHLTEPVIAPTARRPELQLPPVLDPLVLTAMMKDPRARPPAMEQYGEQIAAVAAALPPDPRYPIGPMSGQAPIATPTPAPMMTPPAHSAYHGPSSYPQPTPMPPPQAMMPPPSFAPPTHTTKSRAGLWIALAVLVIGGIGIGAWAMSRQNKADPWDRDAGTPETPPDKPPEPGPTPDKPPEPPAEPAKDPWASNEPAIGTIAGASPNTVPDGARLVLPPGFQTVHGPDATGHSIINHESRMAIALGAIPIGYDETSFVLAMSKQPHMHLDTELKVMSAGGLRDGVRFSTAVNGVSIYQFVVFYPNRLVAVAMVPKVVTQQRGFDQAAREFWANNVVLP